MTKTSRETTYFGYNAFCRVFPERRRESQTKFKLISSQLDALACLSITASRRTARIVSLLISGNE